MTTGVNDFDAAKAIVEQLVNMEKDRQQRILRWVAESLDLKVPVEDSSADGPSTSVTSRSLPPSNDPGAPMRTTNDIKTFVDAKKPKSDMQFAAVVAYFYRFEARPGESKEKITSDLLQDAARLAGRKRLVKPHMTLTNAKNQGYLDAAGHGEFRVNSVGENLVAMTLPGAGGEPRKHPSGGKAKAKKTRAR